MNIINSKGQFVKKQPGYWKGKKRPPFSDEWKKKMSNARKGKPSYKRTPEINEKNRLAHIGKKRTEESKLKQSLKIKSRTFSEEHRRKIGLALLNHPIYQSKVRNEKIKTARLKQIIPHKDTSIEVKLQNWLKEQGIEFETHYPILGQPDIFIKPNICIFADGCYWHKCPTCGYEGEEKRQKDQTITRTLQSQGYTVIRLWEHEIDSNNLNKLANEI